MMTPEDLLARQTEFWRLQNTGAFAAYARRLHFNQRTEGVDGMDRPEQLYDAGAFVGMDRPEQFYAFRSGAPFYGMDRYFCRLVDEARLTIPADEVFRLRDAAHRHRVDLSGGARPAARRLSRAPVAASGRGLDHGA